MSGCNFVATVKESAEGKPWLLVEPRKDIGFEQRHHIVFDLPNGATYDEAAEIKDELNRLKVSVRVARF